MRKSIIKEVNVVEILVTK